MPLAGGGTLYLLARSPSLRLFAWVEALGLAPALGALRDQTHPTMLGLPGWVRLSLPNALWVYAFLSMLALLWDRRLTRASLPWLLAAPILGLGFELGQLAGLVPGTFDVLDLALVLGASALAFARLLVPVALIPAQVKS